MIVHLGDIATARSGDKGNHANIGVIPFNRAAYLFLQRTLTTEVVSKHFADLNPNSVIRYDLPNLEALNFVLENVLSGGGSLSLKLDSQGKTLGQTLLQLALEIPATELITCLRIPGGIHD